MHKTFDVSGPIQVDVQLASGEIRLDRAVDNVVDVELTADDPDMQTLVDAARVELRGQELIVDVPNRRGGFSLSNLFGSRGITCRIRCAEGSSLRARAKSADVSAAMTLAAANVSTASGAGDVGGNLSVGSASGDLTVGHVRGSVNAASASGDVGIDAADGDARATTASGDITFSAVVAGEVSVNSASGDVTIGVRRGSRAYLDCSTVSGDARSELDPAGDDDAGNQPLVQVRARTVSGDIVITRAAAPVANTQEVQA
jgi:hypothetical protein